MKTIELDFWPRITIVNRVLSVSGDIPLGMWRRIDGLYDKFITEDEKNLDLTSEKARDWTNVMKIELEDQDFSFIQNQIKKVLPQFNAQMRKLVVPLLDAFEL